MISAWWLFLIIPLSASTAAFTMALLMSNRESKRVSQEEILDAACDHCHWPYILEDQAELDERCESCPIWRATQ